MSQEFRMLVCGGRDFLDAALLKRWMNQCVKAHAPPGHKVVVIHGAARGADSLAGQIAKRVGVEVRAYPANWTLYGKGAGSIRNKLMLDQEKPHLVLAAPGGSGTADMVRRAKRASVLTIEIPK